jgi:predicted short-subunit dehydrogenase-like oxidoreductase (DUF2520 family)
MIKAVILGAGNLAFHLTNELLNSNAVDLVQVYNRNLKNIAYLENKVAICNDISHLKEADIYIVCVSDNAIAELSNQLFFENKLVVHTSGAMDINELKSHSNKGVLYPLQSFTKEKKVDFSSIPFCIEAQNDTDLALLKTIASAISTKVYTINSEQRKTLHVAAVFVNNFVNHLYYLGNEICDTNNIPFEILNPIIQETSKKIEYLSPFEAQTGPAKRNDSKTIEAHLKTLTSSQQYIYNTLTNSIKATYGKKL